MSEVKVSDSDSSLPEAGSGSPGSILRRCREFHGITLEEASETTKIGISHLKALEDDRIREFANQAYLKGFLRIYATYLSLNSDDVARMYDKLFGVKNEKPISAGSSATTLPSTRRLVSLKKMLFPALLLTVILITATFYKSPPHPIARQPQPVTPVVAPSLNIAVQTVQSSAQNRIKEEVVPALKTEKRPAVPSGKDLTATPKLPTDAGKGFIVKIKVSQSGTLTATVDGSVSQQYELVVGDIIEWKAEKSVTLELSNAGGVDLELNGKPCKPLGPNGKPGYFELDAEGVKQ